MTETDTALPADQQPADQQPTEHELRIERVFDAPRELVFRAWTEPEQVARWLGPYGFTAQSVTGDARPGGGLRSCMRDAGGTDYWSSGVYLVVEFPERLEFTLAWEAPDGTRENETLVTVVFDDLGERTRMVFTQTGFVSTEDRDGHGGGWTQAFDKLAMDVERHLIPGFERNCAELVRQAGLLRDVLREVDAAAPVLTCPGWTAGDLMAHVVGTLGAVTTAATSGPAPQGDLVGVAAGFASAMRAAGPTAVVEVFGLANPASFWIRRALHDVVIHRADASLAAGVEYSVEPELAADAVDELLELIAAPNPAHAEPEGDLHLHATDAPDGVDAEWLVRPGPSGLATSRTHSKAPLALRGPLTDLLLVVYRRRSVHGTAVQALGDEALLTSWLDRLDIG